MRILILGCNGMLGHDLVKVFADYNPTAWDIQNLDITQKKEVKEKINQLKPKVIINAAAYTDVEGAENNKDLAMKVNGEAVGYLAEVCKKKCIILVHYSTEYIFDGKNPEGYSEDAISNPLNVYGESKAFGEKLLQKRGEMYYLIRSSWLYGQAPQVGKPRGLNFVDTILKKAREILGGRATEKELKVVNDQFGKPTWTWDLALKTREIIEQQKPCGIYHVVNETARPQGISWYEFAKEIFRLANLEVKIKPISSSEYPSKAQRPQYSALINTKLPPLRSWQGALKDYLKEKGVF